MDSASVGELVKVADGGPALDGLVVETPSRAKVVVAVMDPARGPVLRTVHPQTLTAREQEGPADRALRLLVRRTHATARGGARGDTGAVSGRSGHVRAPTAHRPTGK